MPFQSLSPQQYAASRQAQSAQSAQSAPSEPSEPSDQLAPALIDVREPWEFDVAHIEGATLLPLGQIYEWAQSLDKDTPYVIMCHHGGRSAMACQVLQSLGFKQVINLDGGIDEWSATVDASVPRY